MRILIGLGLVCGFFGVEVQATEVLPRAQRPQFILVSMDATPRDRALEDEPFYRFQQRVKDVGSFTLFINTGYLQLDPRRAVSAEDRPYQGRMRIDGRRLGRNRPVITYAPSVASIQKRAENIRALHNLGVEIGSHTVRHDHGGEWSQQRWRDEFRDHQRVLDLLNLPTPQGYRAPFLETNAAMYQVMRDYQMIYDTSRGERPRRAWPHRVSGTPMWFFGVPAVRYPRGSNAGMFFDLRIKRGLQSRGYRTPEAWNQAYYEMAMMEFNARYSGARAPFLLSGHGNFMPAIGRFMLEVCTREHVRCVTFAEAAQWMNEHPEMAGAR
jgi:peptidoglycan/xylan/chitin deacetylase (PgdA/CDA1 family)